MNKKVCAPLRANRHAYLALSHTRPPCKLGPVNPNDLGASFLVVAPLTTESGDNSNSMASVKNEGGTKVAKHTATN